jgi:hypothetical protein
MDPFALKELEEAEKGSWGWREATAPVGLQLYHLGRSVRGRFLFQVERVRSTEDRSEHRPGEAAEA